MAMVAPLRATMVGPVTIRRYWQALMSMPSAWNRTVQVPVWQSVFSQQ